MGDVMKKEFVIYTATNKNKVHKQIHKSLGTRKRCRGFYWCKCDDYINFQHGNTEVTA